MANASAISFRDRGLAAATTMCRSLIAFLESWLLHRILSYASSTVFGISLMPLRILPLEIFTLFRIMSKVRYTHR